MPKRPSTPSGLSTYEVLALPHVERLRAFARRRDPANADDLVQETLIKGWQRFVELREQGAIRSWLFQILNTTFLQQRRVGQRRMQLLPITSLQQEHEHLIGSLDAGPLDALIAAQSSEAVRRALAALPDDFAIAVELHDIEGFRYHEVATITEVPIGTVMSRISRGRRLLATLLAKWANSKPHSRRQRS